MKKVNNSHPHSAITITLVFILSAFLFSVGYVKPAKAFTSQCVPSGYVRTLTVNTTYVLQRDETVLAGDKEYAFPANNIVCSDYTKSDKTTIPRLFIVADSNTGNVLEGVSPTLDGAIVINNVQSLQDSGFSYSIGAYVGGVRKYINGQTPAGAYASGWNGYGMEIPMTSHDNVTGNTYFPVVTRVVTIMPSTTRKPKAGTYRASTMYLTMITSNYYMNDNYFVALDITIKIIESACSVKTYRNINVTWPALSPWTISEGDGGAEKKVAPITINCGTTRTPTKVTVTANNILNAANGMINTSLNHLGLALTWASNGQPVPLNQELSYDILGDQDLSIAAKPISVGGTDIPAGDFNATVTMSIEYR